MARKADRTAYENKSEILGTPERIMVEVVKPHDGLEKGCQFSKPYKVAVQMIKNGYWREVKPEVKTNEE